MVGSLSSAGAAIRPCGDRSWCELGWHDNTSGRRHNFAARARPRKAGRRWRLERLAGERRQLQSSVRFGGKSDKGEETEEHPDNALRAEFGGSWIRF